MTTYPLAPKTNAQLSPGQFWSIPLGDGRFGCGRVLRVERLRPAEAERLVDRAADEPAEPIVDVDAPAVGVGGEEPDRGTGCEGEEERFAPSPEAELRQSCERRRSGQRTVHERPPEPVTFQRNAATGADAAPEPSLYSRLPAIRSAAAPVRTKGQTLNQTTGVREPVSAVNVASATSAPASTR